MQTYEDLVRMFMVPWDNIRRWRVKPRPTKETVTMHTFKECLHTILALSQEAESAHPPDPLKVLTAKLFHDIGEGLLGCDIIYPIKQVKGLGEILEEIESDEIEKYLDLLPKETRQSLEKALKLLGDKRTREGKLVDAIEFYGYISFALTEIKTTGKGSSNTVGFYKVIQEHGDDLWRYEKNFKFVRDFKELAERLENVSFDMDFWLPEFTLRKILGSLVNPEIGRAWPHLKTDENLLERTMKTAFLAAFLIPQEKAHKTRFDGYKVLCTALVHKLDKVNFPVLSPRMRKNKKLRRYERAIRKLQKEYMLPLIGDFPPETQDVILQAYLLERDRDSIEGRFFDAVKNLSYVLFAHYEYTSGKKEFYRVFENCDSDLTAYSEEFRSIRQTYMPVKKDFQRLAKEKSEYEEMSKRIEALEKEKEKLKKRVDTLTKKK